MWCLPRGALTARLEAGQSIWEGERGQAGHPDLGHSASTHSSQEILPREEGRREVCRFFWSLTKISLSFTPPFRQGLVGLKALSSHCQPWGQQRCLHLPAGASPGRGLREQTPVRRDGRLRPLRTTARRQPGVGCQRARSPASRGLRGPHAQTAEPDEATQLRRAARGWRPAPGPSPEQVAVDSFRCRDAVCSWNRALSVLPPPRGLCRVSLSSRCCGQPAASPRRAVVLPLLLLGTHLDGAGVRLGGEKQCS